MGLRKKKCKVTNVVTNTESTLKNTASTYIDTGCYDADVTLQDMQLLLYSGSIFYNVLLFEFADCKGYFTQDRIDDINAVFNDTTPNNWIYSVHEYFSDLSYGKVNFLQTFWQNL